VVVASVLEVLVFAVSVIAVLVAVSLLIFQALLVVLMCCWRSVHSFSHSPGMASYEEFNLEDELSSVFGGAFDEPPSEVPCGG
jgi:hypothetical protein